MAQVPNYYYNSPWIADAARSLASALAPADPQKQLEFQRADWQFKQQQEQAKLAAHDRSEKDLAESFFAQIAQFEPILKEDGTEDTEATERAVMKLYGQGIEHGGDIAKGMSLSGPYAPEFTAKQIIQQIKAQGSAAAIAQRYGYLGDLQDARFRNQEVTDNRRQGFKVDLANINYKNRLSLQADAAERRIAAKRAAATLPGAKPPRMIPRSAMEDIIYGFDLKEESELGGRKIPKKYKDKMVEDAEDLVQSGGKVQTAINAVWSGRGLDDVEDVPRKTFMGVEYGDLPPVIPRGYDTPASDTPAPAPEVKPGSLGATAIGAGAAPGMLPSATPKVPGAVPSKRAPDGRMLPAPQTEEEYNSLMNGEDYIVPTTGEVFTKGANGR